MSQNKPLAAITLAALGVVYGDIGTSPLYTLKECFAAAHIAPSQINVLGFVSLIAWAILLVVTLKYVLFVLRADNKGEGGVVVMMQQAITYLQGKPKAWVLLLGLTGTAMFYGDSVITPAISVLSAAEGLTVLNPNFEHWVMPIAIAVLVTLFWVQKHGTQKIGILFGPVMLLWFTVLGAIGLSQVIRQPQVLAALNPYYAWYFITHHGYGGFVALGSVVLALTGAEALYADMGHFGRKPIQIAWFGLVLPGLMLNYMGQGALILSNPAAISNPFFLSAPSWGVLPLILLATAATVIASQAVISGAYSLTRQAIQLGFSPRMKIVHTSAEEMGQIYLPGVNWLLLTVVLLVIAMFQSSGNLAAAYGIAATGTMIITSILFCIVMINNWRWPKLLAFGLTAVFLAFDITFFSSNLLKLAHGGWLPMLIAAVIVFIFTTWRLGRKLMARDNQDGSIPLEGFITNLAEYPPQSVQGTAIYMVSDADVVPKALLHNLKHNKILHQRNVLLSIRTLDMPFVADSERLHITELPSEFIRIVADYGFQETPDVVALLALLAKDHNLDFELMDTSFFLSHDNLTLAKHGKMSRFRAALFLWLSKNSTRATDYYNIPNNRVVELGSQLAL